MKNILKSLFVFAVLFASSAVAMEYDINEQVTDTTCTIQQGQPEQTGTSDTCVSDKKLDQLVQAVLKSKSPSSFERAAFMALRFLVIANLRGGIIRGTDLIYYAIDKSLFQETKNARLYTKEGMNWLSNILQLVGCVAIYGGYVMTPKDHTLNELSSLEKYIQTMSSKQREAIAAEFTQNYATQLAQKIKPEEYDLMVNMGEATFYTGAAIVHINEIVTAGGKTDYLQLNPPQKLCYALISAFLLYKVLFSSSDSSKKTKILARIQKELSAAQLGQAKAMTAK